MDDTLKETLGIVRAQAGHRIMTGDEIVSMISSLNAKLVGMMSGEISPESTEPTMDPKKSIKEKSITCLECGKVMKVLTQRHLSSHGITADEYRLKYGMKKGTALASKSLSKARKTKMQDMKLWERRRKVEAPAA